jgi:hypothetical protein
MELHAEAINAPLIKYFNCQSKSRNHTVKHNSDFAKLYRLTMGINPSKQFSKAQQLLGHFLESRFFAKYEQATLKGGVRYLKAIHLEPETPTINSGWTANGTLKKTSKKRIIPTPINGDEVATDWRRDGEKVAKTWRQVGDDETLQAAISLGLEPVFNPTKTLPIQGKTTYTLDHTPDGDFLFSPEALTFYNDRLDVLLNNFEFEKTEAEALAKQATIMQFSEKTECHILLART